MSFLKAFVAGFISTLVFHQGGLALLHAAGVTDRAAFPMSPTGPLHVPAVVSLAFWGGLWGVALWMMIGRIRESGKFWTLAFALGAILPTLVALFVVLPLKGQPVGGGWKPAFLVGALILNGLWGLGVGVLMRLMDRKPANR